MYLRSANLDQRSRRVLAIFSNIRLEKLVCCDCGLAETYLAGMEDVKRVKARCLKVGGQP